MPVKLCSVSGAFQEKSSVFCLGWPPLLETVSAVLCAVFSFDGVAYLMSVETFNLSPLPYFGEI